MKIHTDSTLGKLSDENGCTIISLPPYEYEGLIQRIFSQSQQYRHVEHDGLFTLSKKATKILMEEISKRNGR